MRGLALLVVSAFAVAQTTPTPPTTPQPPPTQPPPSPPFPFCTNYPTKTRECLWEPSLSSKDSYYTCWRSSIVYSSASYSVQFSDIRIIPTIVTLSSYARDASSWSPGLSFSTLCDGHPRAPPGEHPTIYQTTITVTREPYTSSIRDPDVVLHWPTIPPCKIPDDSRACTTLLQAYASMSSVFFDNRNNEWMPFGLWYPPGCHASLPPVPEKTYPCPTPAPGRFCYLTPASLTQLYWPETTVNGDLCRQDGTVVTSIVSPTAVDGSPNTAVWQGKTITSPTVLMVIGKISSTGCGTTLRQATLTMNQSDLSKIFWSGTGRETRPITLDNLNTVPYDVYNLEMCENNNILGYIRYGDCSTVFGRYSPYLSVPTASVTKLLADWEGCELQQYAKVVEWVPLGPVPKVGNGEGFVTRASPASVEATVTPPPTVF